MVEIVVRRRVERSVGRALSGCFRCIFGPVFRLEEVSIAVGVYVLYANMPYCLVQSNIEPALLKIKSTCFPASQPAILKHSSTSSRGTISNRSEFV